MSQHSAAVMRYQDPAFLCRSFEEFRIFDAFQSGFVRRGKVQAWFSLADTGNDGAFEIGVRLKAKAQVRGSPILARARSSFSQRAGFTSCIGMVLASNSPSVRARYSSISAWWSR